MVNRKENKRIHKKRNFRDLNGLIDSEVVTNAVDLKKKSQKGYKN